MSGFSELSIGTSPQIADTKEFKGIDHELTMCPSITRRTISDRARPQVLQVFNRIATAEGNADQSDVGIL